MRRGGEDVGRIEKPELPVRVRREAPRASVGAGRDGDGHDFIGGLHVGEMCTNQSRFGDAGWHDPGGLTARRKDPLVGCSAKMKAVRWSPATWDSFTA